MKKLLILLVLAGGLMAGAAYWVTHRSSDGGKVAYSTVPIEFGSLTEMVTATALVQPARVYLVGTAAQGEVVEVCADFNQEVEEGAVLLRIDDRLLRQKLDQSAEAIEAARKQVSQIEAERDSAHVALQQERSLSPAIRSSTKVQLLEARYRAASAAVEAVRAKVNLVRTEQQMAELALRHTVVRVPVLKATDQSPTRQAPGIGALAQGEPAGEKKKFIVLDRKVSLGQMVGPPLSGHLFTLAGDLSVMHVEAQVAEGDVGKVAVGLAAEFTVASSEGDLQFQGKVIDVRLLPINDRGAIFYKVVIEAKNERDPISGRWRLAPGLTANVDILRRQHRQVWKMPAIALSFQPEDAQLDGAAKEKLKRWETMRDRDQWKAVWVVGENGKPWPIFVRLGGKSAAGELGIRDLSYTEVLEWESDLSPRPDPVKPETLPQVIIAAPPGKSGLFNPPNIKF